MAILMTEEFWRNSQFSIARHYGGAQIEGKQYIIVNDRGMDLWECTAEAERMGRDKAIEPGEPADLIRKDFQKYYKKLGRRKFIAILEANKDADDKELKNIMKLTQTDYKPTDGAQVMRGR